MNIQIYSGKKNFDTQKAERYFKERRIPVQMMDLKKHPLGEREIRLMIQQIGTEKLIDREDKKVKEHPACYYDRDELEDIRKNLGDKWIKDLFESEFGGTYNDVFYGESYWKDDEDYC